MARTKQTTRKNLKDAPTAANQKGGSGALKGARRRSDKEREDDPDGSIGASSPHAATRGTTAKKKAATTKPPTMKGGRRSKADVSIDKSSDSEYNSKDDADSSSNGDDEDEDAAIVDDEELADEDADSRLAEHEADDDEYETIMEDRVNEMGSDYDDEGDTVPSIDSDYFDHELEADPGELSYLAHEVIRAKEREKAFLALNPGKTADDFLDEVVDMTPYKIPTEWKEHLDSTAPSLFRSKPGDDGFQFDRPEWLEYLETSQPDWFVAACDGAALQMVLKKVAEEQEAEAPAPATNAPRATTKRASKSAERTERAERAERARKRACVGPPFTPPRITRKPTDDTSPASSTRSHTSPASSTRSHKQVIGTSPSSATRLKKPNISPTVSPKKKKDSFPPSPAEAVSGRQDTNLKKSNLPYADIAHDLHVFPIIANEITRDCMATLKNGDFRSNLLLKPDDKADSPRSKQAYDHFSKYILREKDWTVDNLLKLTIICTRAFASGKMWPEIFKHYITKYAKAEVFHVAWCKLFNRILLPHLDDSPNTSFGPLDVSNNALEEAVRITNFTVGSAILAKEAKDLPDYQHIEPSFHRITSTLCPLVNLLFLPMCVSNDKEIEVHVDFLQPDNYGVAPYIVPQVNHRQKNPTLVLGLTGDTLMSETPTDHLRGEYTTLPFRMISSADSVGLKICPLKNWDSSDRSFMTGGPTALLLGNSDELPPGESHLLFRALQFRDDKHSLDFGSLCNTAQSLKSMFKHATRSSSEPVDGRLQDLGVHTMTKKLLNLHIMKVAAQKNMSLCRIFSNISGLIKANTPSLRPFFPYNMSEDSIYPFHHLRVLLGTLTTIRGSMLEGNHRSFVSVDGLLGGFSGGHAATTKGQKLNSGLLLQPAKFNDVLPCIPNTRPCSIDGVVLKACQSYSQLLQERLGNYGETSPRDVFIAALARIVPSTLKEVITDSVSVHKKDCHPFLISDDLPLLFTTSEEMSEYIAQDIVDNPLPNNKMLVIQEVMDLTVVGKGSENARITNALKKLFVAEVSKRTKKRKFSNEEDSKPPLRMEANHVLHQKKLLRWIEFISVLLESDSNPVKALINETLIALKINVQEQQRAKTVRMCIVRIVKNLLLRSTLTSVNATDLKFGAFGGLYVLGGIYCDFVYDESDLLELNHFFQRLPAGVGSYEDLYLKDSTWKSPNKDRLLFQECGMDLPTIYTLGKMFFHCANSIAEAIRLHVNSRIQWHHTNRCDATKTLVIPTKKFLYPIIFRHVATSWLKILNCVGMVIHPTEHTEQLVPELAQNLRSSLTEENILINLMKTSIPAPFTNLEILSDFICGIFGSESKSNFIVTDNFVQFVREELKSDMVFDADPSERTMPTLMPAADIVSFEFCFLDVTSTPKDMLPLTQSNISNVSLEQLVESFFMSTQLKGSGPKPRRFKNPCGAYVGSYEERFGRSPAVPEELNVKMSPPVPPAEEAVGMEARAGGLGVEDGGNDGELGTNVPRRVTQAHQKVLNPYGTEDGLDEASKLFSNKVLAYVQTGKCGSKTDKLEVSSIGDRLEKMGCLLTTLGHLCAFQHAKYSAEKVSSEDAAVFSKNFGSLMKQTLRLTTQKPGQPKATSQERANNTKVSVSAYGIILSGTMTLQHKYLNILEGIMDDDTLNLEQFEPKKKPPVDDDYTGKWDLDSFDKLMTDLNGTKTETLRLPTRNPQLYARLTETLLPTGNPHLVASTPINQGNDFSAAPTIGVPAAAGYQRPPFRAPPFTAGSYYPEHAGLRLTNLSPPSRPHQQPAFQHLYAPSWGTGVYPPPATYQAPFGLPREAPLSPSLAPASDTASVALTEPTIPQSPGSPEGSPPSTAGSPDSKFETGHRNMRRL